MSTTPIENGRVPDGTGLSSSTEPASSLGPSGFDPSRCDRLQRLWDAEQAQGDQLLSVIPAGHRCGPISVTAEQWDAGERADEAVKAARAELMPTEQDAIKVLWEGYQRLREFGWREAMYCPKDGTEFDAIEAGSTGIHRCHYSGEWPSGSWWVAEAGDLWPSKPILYRPPPEELAADEERRKRFRALSDSDGSPEGRDREDGLDGEAATARAAESGIARKDKP